MTQSLAPLLRPFLFFQLGIAAAAGDPASCKTVKFSDVGWTDITATTATTSAILQGLGYTPHTDVLSVPVTYQSLAQQADRRLSRQLDADHGSGSQALRRRRHRHGRRHEPHRRQIYARRAGLYLRGRAQELRRHRQVQGPARRQGLRHRTGQRRQPPDPRHDQGRQVRPDGVRPRRSRASKACSPRSSAPRSGTSRSCSSAGSRIR